MGGRVKDLEIFLNEERLPEGWESRVRKSRGLTNLAFFKSALAVEKGVDESKFAPAAKE